VNAVVNFRVALNAGNFLINLGAISLSIWAVLQRVEENIPIIIRKHFENAVHWWLQRCCI
jgi:hypothetical protein